MGTAPTSLPVKLPLLQGPANSTNYSSNFNSGFSCCRWLEGLADCAGTARGG